MRNYQLAALIRKLLVNWMSKHKSEVLTVKIQLKVKFRLAVIYKIRTVPPVFLKMFRTAVWRKTRESCFWNYEWKTINLCKWHTLWKSSSKLWFLEPSLLPVGFHQNSLNPFPLRDVEYIYHPPPPHHHPSCLWRLHAAKLG